jgi:hypothetical protein
MARRVDLFCEDAAHEAWARALLTRLAAQQEVEVSIQVASARFGVGRLKRELRAYEALLGKEGGLPDLLVVIVDANAVGVAARRAEIAEAIDLEAFPVEVVGVPDPCVEHWLLADPTSFAKRFGEQPELPETGDCDQWKAALVKVLERAGEIVTGGGGEFAEEIVEVMDLYRAGKASRSLKQFVDDLRAALKRLA